MYSQRLETVESQIVLCYPSMQPAGILDVLGPPVCRGIKMGNTATLSPMFQIQSYMCEDMQKLSREEENTKTKTTEEIA